MTTDKSSKDRDELSEGQDTDIVAMEETITSLKIRNNSLTIAIEKVLSVPTNFNIAESMLCSGQLI